MKGILSNCLKPGAFRLFLSILVVLFHASRYFPFGDFAVNTFFILSGYWIYRMYDTHYSFQEKPYKSFIYSRFLRIFPLYYLCTFIALCIVSTNSTILSHKLSDFLNFNQIFSISTLITYSYLEEKLLIPAWSLGIELQFYLIAPMFIFFIKKTNGRAFFLLIFILTLFGLMNSNDIIRFSVLSYLAYFGIGMLIWYYKPTISKKTTYLSIFFVVLVIGIHYVIPVLREALFIRKLTIYGFNYYAIFGRVLPILLIPFIVFNLNQISEKRDRIFGDISYTVYIFHWIPFSIYNYYFAQSATFIRGLGFICYLVTLAISSWIIYIVFEKRFENFRRSLLNKA